MIELILRKLWLAIGGWWGLFLISFCVTIGVIAGWR